MERRTKHTQKTQHLECIRPTNTHKATQARFKQNMMMLWVQDKIQAQEVTTHQRWNKKKTTTENMLCLCYGAYEIDPSRKIHWISTRTTQSQTARKNGTIERGQYSKGVINCGFADEKPKRRTTKTNTTKAICYGIKISEHTDTGKSLCHAFARNASQETAARDNKHPLQTTITPTHYGHGQLRNERFLRGGATHNATLAQATSNTR